jgi:hypothetical protein
VRYILRAEIVGSGVVACLEDRVPLTFIEPTAPRIIGHMPIRSFTPKTPAPLQHEQM